MSGIAQARLSEERRLWRRDHPFGFVACPARRHDGTLDLMVWDFAVPGKAGTIWENGLYRGQMTFSEDFPTTPPKVRFVPPLFHPNVYPSGTICLSLLNEEEDWRPSVGIKQLLFGIQELLDNPNPSDPAQEPAYKCFVTNKTEYERKVKEQAKKMSV